eukprot:scaffold85160_cov32-Prasinocladus_malaysianus.AAC.1
MAQIVNVAVDHVTMTAATRIRARQNVHTNFRMAPNFIQSRTALLDRRPCLVLLRAPIVSKLVPFQARQQEASCGCVFPQQCVSLLSMLTVCGVHPAVQMLVSPPQFDLKMTLLPLPMPAGI